MQTHLPIRTLSKQEKPDKDVEVMFATQSDKKALLFIHGYSGDALGTWSYFPQLLQDCPACARRDLIFYGYDGLWAEMVASASLFRNFLNRLFNKWSHTVNSSLPPLFQRSPGYKYEELTIIAHSLGAVIARRALLDATKVSAEWAPRVKLVLYAPAHKGANVNELMAMACSTFNFLRPVQAGVKFASPLIKQLEPDSPDLKALLSETQKACDKGANPQLKAKKVVIAEYEKIVRNESFGDDPPPETIPNTNHVTVCKPRVDFRKPLEHLEESLLC